MKNWESSKYRNRSGWSYSSDSFRTTILKGGGHIAELTMLNTKSGDINPLWSVPWDSIEPEDYEKYCKAFLSNKRDHIVTTVDYSPIVRKNFL